MTRPMLLVEQTNRAVVNFLMIDAKTALTFSGIALTSTDSAKRERAFKIARRAYNTILRLKATVWMTNIEAETLASDLLRLDVELEAFEETLYSTGYVY